MLYFLDTSALVKLYVQESGTDRLLRLVRARPPARLAVLTLSAVEIRSAIRRRQREGDIMADAAEAILRSVQRHLENRFVKQPVDEGVLDAALAMIDRYALRAYDAVQLGGCLAIAARSSGPLTFVCSDRRLLEAAQSERLPVLDPAA